MAARFEQGLLVTYSALGHEQLTVGTTAVGLPNLPDLAKLRRVVVRNLGEPMNWRDDGTSPTANTGFPSLADEIMVFDGDFEQLEFIRSASAGNDIDVRIAYYGT